MRAGFVHEALIELVPDTDEATPGAAVTAALCGHWEHEGTCRWPHRTSIIGRSGPSLRVRVVFASPADEEPAVRQLISRALGEGRLGDKPRFSHWTVVTQGQSELQPDEERLADHLLAI